MGIVAKLFRMYHRFGSHCTAKHCKATERTAEECNAEHCSGTQSKETHSRAFERSAVLILDFDGAITNIVKLFASPRDDFEPPKRPLFLGTHIAKTDAKSGGIHEIAG